MSDSEGTEASTSVRASAGSEMSVTAVVLGDEDGVAVTDKGGCGCSSSGVRGSVRTRYCDAPSVFTQYCDARTQKARYCADHAKSETWKHRGGGQWDRVN